MRIYKNLSYLHCSLFIFFMLSLNCSFTLQVCFYWLQFCCLCSNLFQLLRCIYSNLFRFGVFSFSLLSLFQQITFYIIGFRFWVSFLVSSSSSYLIHTTRPYSLYMPVFYASASVQKHYFCIVPLWA